MNLPLLFDSKGNKIINDKGKPTVKPNLRYLFWEIDSQDKQLLKEVLLVYEYYELDVYVHESMRGYHFISLEELPTKTWGKAVTDLRPTNDMYPPITLRIKPNKYKRELIAFRRGFIHNNVIDGRTNDKIRELKLWIESQFIGLINKHYYLVTYPMDNNDIDNKLTLKQREREFLQQIEDSPI